MKYFLLTNYDTLLLTINLNNIYLTDNFEKPNKYKFPNVSLDSNDFRLIWADGETFQSSNHANFKLDKNGEEIGLFEKVGAEFHIIQIINYENASTNVSYGAIADGDLNISELPYITPNYSNVREPLNLTQIDYNQFFIYHNKVNKYLTINSNIIIEDLKIYNAFGGFTASYYINENVVDVSNLSFGYYFLIINNKEVAKFLKY